MYRRHFLSKAIQGLFLFLSFMSQPATPIVLDSLYEVALKVPDKLFGIRQALFIKGFEQILVKLTGDLAVLNTEGVKVAETQIDKYVSQFSYHDRPETGLQLEVKFNEKMVNLLIKTIKLPYLGKNRPLTMVWLVIETPESIKLVGGTAYMTVALKLEELAITHSIPVVLPLLDLAETSKVRVEDVVNLSVEILSSAATWYQADIILAGHIMQLPGVWQGKWHLFGDQPVKWDTSGESVLFNIEHAFSALTTNLVNQYSSRALYEKGADSVSIKVLGINSLEDYANVLSYLTGLSVVEGVEVISVTSKDVTFNLHTGVGKVAVKKAISLDRILLQAAYNDFDDSFIALKYKVRK